MLNFEFLGLGFLQIKLINIEVREIYFWGFELAKSVFCSNQHLEDDSVIFTLLGYTLYFRDLNHHENRLPFGFPSLPNFCRILMNDESIT